MTVKKIRVVQYGTWGMSHADHIMMTMRNMPGVYEVAGVCEENEERRERAKRHQCYDGLPWCTKDEILNDKSIDAVIIESHETEQDKDALDFAKAGFNIHLEKPGGMSSAFAETVRAAKEKKRVFHMGYMYRYNPAVKYAFDLVSSGKLGKINYVEAQMSTCYGEYGLDFLSKLPGGMTFYLGCHLIDIMYRIMGKPDEIIPMNFSTGSKGINALDAGFVIYNYNGLYSFVKTSASEINGDARRQIVISGSKGTVEIMPLENPLEAPKIVCPGDVGIKITYDDYYTGIRNFEVRSEYIKFPLYGRYDNMMMDFANKVNGESETIYTYEYENAVHDMILKSINLTL